MAFDELPHHAGWYRDPEAATGERWWNGSQWTSHTRPDALSTGSTALEGLPPKAWSEADWTATDAPPVTVSPASVSPWTPSGTTAFAVDGPVQPAMPPVPLSIAPGWYPDPNGLPAQRWWDGTGWTEHSAPFAAAFPPPPPGRYSGYGYSAPYGTTNIVVMAPQKSVGVAFVLTWFFGPLGMLYSTVSGALIMLGVSVIGTIFIGIVTFGLGLVVLWPLIWVASIIWGCVAAANQRGPSVTSTYR